MGSKRTRKEYLTVDPDETLDWDVIMGSLIDRVAKEDAIRAMIMVETEKGFFEVEVRKREKEELDEGTRSPAFYIS